MNDHRPEIVTDPFDSIIKNFATKGLRHRMEAGGKVAASTDEDFDANRRAWLEAKSCLAAVMILRHIRRVAPELMAEVVDVNMTAELLSEFGVALKLDAYLRESGGSPESVLRIVDMEREATAS